MFSRFLDDYNFVSSCKKYGLGLWQCPNFLFLMMGFITIVTMVGTYFVSSRFGNEGTTIMSVTFEVAIIFTIGSFIIRGVERVAEANIMKTEFISIISHQLCTPLSAIKWNTEILETERDPKECIPEKQSVFLGNIKKSNEQMLKMVTDLLEVARIDQGRAVFEEKPLDLANLVNESIEGFQSIVAEKNVKIEPQIEPNLQKVCGDEKKMRVVLDNLIGNAIKYSKEGGKVEIKLGMKGRNIFFSVRDWGVGIPHFQHSKVFEKFFRSRNESRYRTDGVGIGLYLVRAILKHCGGKVWFESKAGEGSIFYFSLPIVK
ncbi:MAG TPA: HAMP domain-containing sensor histidine kinase [Candidatus Bathyarchaeia archaeon]|nr:HAMP domain-containing sensor histidine kinase [Candidatus Bathyarchaeia archaeon]